MKSTGIELKISCSDTMLNYRLSQKFKLLENSEFNHLTISLTTGMKVNVEKNEIVPVREVSNTQTLANILQCRVSSLPMIYLGMPLGTSYKTASI